MSAYGIKVWKPLRTKEGGWRVDCAHCDGNDFLANLLGQPFVTAKRQREALILAEWLRRLHDERRCDSCGVTPKIEPIQVLPEPRGTFAFEGHVYQIIGTEVRQLEAVSA